jgi:hypothetical protein
MKMASIVSNPLSIFRRQRRKKIQEPLHARWGDVSISAPTDGAWAQFDKAQGPGNTNYGPGFVPDCDDVCFHPSESVEESEDEVTLHTSRKSRAHPRQLPRILTPSRLPRRILQGCQKKPTFAYKPIAQDYSHEIVEKVTAPRVRYIPASEQLLKELASISPIDQPKSLPIPPSNGAPPIPWTVLQQQELWKLEGDSSESSYSPENAESTGFNTDTEKSQGSKKKHTLFRQRTRSEKKRGKAMTLTMVSDPEEIW